jgi:hypothetical protein
MYLHEYLHRFFLHKNYVSLWLSELVNHDLRILDTVDNNELIESICC